jgi:hypothetical protein
MNTRVLVLGFTLAFLGARELNGDDPLPANSALPKTIAVKDVVAILLKTKITGQGSGGTTWNGEKWDFYINAYKPVKLPWNSEPQRVESGFVFGRRPGENHLISFSGPGFKYSRATNDSFLTLEPTDK